MSNSNIPSDAAFTGASVNQGEFKTEMATLLAMLRETIGANGGKALGHGSVVLSYTSATAITLLPRHGNRLLVKTGTKWELREVGASGIVGNNTSVFVDGVAAQNLVADTVYNVYVFDNGGTLTIDFSTTGTATDADTGVIIKSGLATRTYVGQVTTNSSSQFEANAIRTVHSVADDLLTTAGDLLTRDATDAQRLALGPQKGYLRSDLGGTGIPKWVEEPVIVIKHVEPSGTGGGTCSSGSWQRRRLTTDFYNDVVATTGLTRPGVVRDLIWDNSSSGAFANAGWIVEGQTSGAQALIVQGAPGSAGTLKVINVSGTFQDNEYLHPAGEGIGDGQINIPSPTDTATGLNFADQVFLPAGDYEIDGFSHAYRTNDTTLRIYNDTAAAEIEKACTQYVANTNSISNPLPMNTKFALAANSLIGFEHYAQTTQSGNGFGATGTLGFDNVYFSARIKRVW